MRVAACTHTRVRSCQLHLPLTHLFIPTPHWGRGCRRVGRQSLPAFSSLSGLPSGNWGEEPPPHSWLRVSIYKCVRERERAGKGGKGRWRQGEMERGREREKQKDTECEREREGEGDRAVQPLVQGSNPGILGHGLRLAHSPCACARTHTEVRLHEHSLTQTPMYTHIHTCTRTCMSDTAPASFTSVSCLALSTAPGK